MTALPEIKEIHRWHVEPGDRLILRVDQDITPEQVLEIRHKVRVALELPDDIPIVIMGTNWDVEVASVGGVV